MNICSRSFLQYKKVDLVWFGFVVLVLVCQLNWSTKQLENTPHGVYLISSQNEPNGTNAPSLPWSLFPFCKGFGSFFTLAHIQVRGRVDGMLSTCRLSGPHNCVTSGLSHHLGRLIAACVSSPRVPIGSHTQQYMAELSKTKNGRCRRTQHEVRDR